MSRLYHLIKLEVKVRLYLVCVGLATLLVGGFMPITTLEGLENAVKTIRQETIDYMTSG